MNQSSFAFTIKEEKWTWAEDRAGGKDLRTITKIEKLYDVSPVTYPANPNTDVHMNSDKNSEKIWRDARAKHEAEIEERKKEEEASKDNQDKAPDQVTISNETYKRKLKLMEL